MSNIKFLFNLNDSKITLPSGYEIKIKNPNCFFDPGHYESVFIVDNDDLHFHKIVCSRREITIYFGSRVITDYGVISLKIHISKKNDFELFKSMHTYPELFEDDNYSHTAVNYNN